MKKHLLRKIATITLVLTLLIPTTALAIGDVSGVTATAGDKEIALSWTSVPNASFYRIYNGTESVDSNEAYNLPTISTPNNETQTVVTGLTNGLTYFFSITAVDAEGNESEFYSDPEVSATPQASATSSGSTDNEDAITDDLKVASVKVPNNETILITFNNPVLLPANSVNKFKITYNFNNSNLAVENIGFKQGSSDEKTIEIKTLPQEPGGEYTIVIPQELTGKNGGTLSQSQQIVIFTGSEALPGGQTVAQNDDIVSDVFSNTRSAIPEGELGIVSAEATSTTEIVVEFNKPVVLPLAGLTPFTILKNSDPNQELIVDNFTLDVDNPAKVILTTDKQDEIAYTIVAANITDTNGNLINKDHSFIEINASEADLTPPEDVTNLKAALSSLSELIVKLSWTPSINTTGDLAGYIIRYGIEGSILGSDKSVGKDLSSFEISELADQTPNTKYVFEISAVDASGNESEGVQTTITLPETGPGLAGLALFSVGGGRYLARRKRKID